MPHLHEDAVWLRLPKAKGAGSLWNRFRGCRDREIPVVQEY
jgi:hypothetical protein